jgi:hypothetical protein
MEITEMETLIGENTNAEGSTETKTLIEENVTNCDGMKTA